MHERPHPWRSRCWYFFMYGCVSWKIRRVNRAISPEEMAHPPTSFSFSCFPCFLFPVSRIEVASYDDVLVKIFREEIPPARRWLFGYQVHRTSCWQGMCRQPSSLVPIFANISPSPGSVFHAVRQRVSCHRQPVAGKQRWSAVS